MKLTPLLKITAGAGLVLVTTQSLAAIALDRTRVVFPGGEDSISMTIANENQQLPYLAQGWIENERGEKITSPFIVLPPVQRVEPGSKTMVKIQGTAGVNTLPQDRESLFYFNLREIPPRSTKANVLQLALQTKIKMFYRPAALLSKNGAAPWQESLTLNRSGDSYTVHNPTPYYVTINDARATSTSVAGKKKFRAVMVPPNGDAPLGVSAGSLGNAPVLEYINDFGGRPALIFICSSGTCKVASNKKG